MLKKKKKKFFRLSQRKFFSSFVNNSVCNIFLTARNWNEFVKRTYSWCVRRRTLRRVSPSSVRGTFVSVLEAPQRRLTEQKGWKLNKKKSPLPSPHTSSLFLWELRQTRGLRRWWRLSIQINGLSGIEYPTFGCSGYENYYLLRNVTYVNKLSW